MNAIIPVHETLDNDPEPCQTPATTDADPPIGTVEPRVSDSKNSPEISRSSNWGGPRPGFGGKQPGAGRPKKVWIKPQLIYPEDPHWYCVNTEHEGEISADMAIRTAGFETLFPLLWIAGTPARRLDNGRSIPAKGEKLVPLFRRYLFVRFVRSDPNWRYIPGMRGVSRIISDSPERPTKVPDGVIEALRSRLAPNLAYYPPGRGPKLPALEVGAQARIPGSAFPDLVGICEWSDEARVRLLMKFMGRDVPVMAKRGDVEAVEQ